MSEQTVSPSPFVKVAIDGPSASGKSTTARRLASIHSLIYIDSGAIYRSVTLVSILAGLVEPFQPDRILSLFDKFDLEMSVPDPNTLEVIIRLNGIDITSAIRTETVDKWVSLVAKHGAIREKVKKIQQRMIDPAGKPAGISGVIMDGRDIGTCIMPDAQVKIFLKASAEVRAQRRLEQSGSKSENYQAILEGLKGRDREDESREHCPLVAAKDAVILDNSSMSFDEQVSQIDLLITKALASKQ